MEDPGDFWVPKRKGAPRAKKPPLKEDDDLKGHLIAPELQQAVRQHQNSEYLIESLETLTAGKTTYLPSTHHDPPPEDSKEVPRITVYGNRPKWSPFVDKFTGEIDTRALSRYHDSFKNPPKPPRNNNNNHPRNSTRQPTRRFPLDQAQRTTFARPPPATGANSLPLGRSHSQPQMQGPALGPKVQGHRAGYLFRQNLSMHNHMNYEDSTPTAAELLPRISALPWRQR
jgi:hypothetical protein